MFREATNAVLLMAQNVDELKRIKGVYDKADNQQTYDTAKHEQFDNYAGAQQNFKGAVQGLQDQIFQPLEGPLTHIFNTVADGIREVAGASDSAKLVMDAVLVTGTTLAGLKTAGTLATMAGGLMKFATGAEQVGPLVGALGLLADVPFLPIVAGIGAVVAGFEAFEHRAELWHKFELWKNGDVDTPTTPAEADELRDKVDRDRKAMADHAKAIEDHAATMDPAVRAAREHASEVLRRGLLAVDLQPEVKAARAELARVENHNPRHDQSIFDAGVHLRQVEADYAKRQATTDARIAQLFRVVDHVKSTDPLAKDAELHGTQVEIAQLRARLGAAAEKDPTFRTLDDGRKAREAKLLDEQQRTIAKALEWIEAERDRLGAPKVTADDVTTARKAAEAAPAIAQDQHRAAVEAAQAELDRVVAAARQTVEQSQAVVEANAAAAQAVDSARNGPQARMEKAADPTLASLAADIAKLSGVVADYDRAHGRAYDESHPTFTRPENAPTPPPAAGHDARGREMPNAAPAVPTFAAPPFDPARITGHAPGSMFTLEGPKFDAGSIAGTLSAAIMRTIYPERHEAQKVDVHSDVAVRGTVEGKGEVNGKLEASVQPSPYLLATIRRAELAGTMALHGNVGGSGDGGDYMGGPNGVKQHPATNGMLGHV